MKRFLDYENEIANDGRTPIVTNSWKGGSSRNSQKNESSNKKQKDATSSTKRNNSNIDANVTQLNVVDLAIIDKLSTDEINYIKSTFSLDLTINEGYLRFVRWLHKACEIANKRKYAMVYLAVKEEILNPRGAASFNILDFIQATQKIMRMNGCEIATAFEGVDDPNKKVFRWIKDNFHFENFVKCHVVEHEVRDKKYFYKAEFKYFNVDPAEMLILTLMSNNNNKNFIYLNKNDARNEKKCRYHSVIGDRTNNLCASARRVGAVLGQKENVIQIVVGWAQDDTSISSGTSLKSMSLQVLNVSNKVKNQSWKNLIAVFGYAPQLQTIKFYRKTKTEDAWQQVNQSMLKNQICNNLKSILLKKSMTISRDFLSKRQFMQ